jgi:hypothetical protein
MAAPARRVYQRPRKATPTRIEVTQKNPAAVLRPNAGVTLVAQVFRNSDPLEGVVEWDATGSDAVGIVQIVNVGTKHEATLVAFDRDGARASSALIRVTAKIGNLSHAITVPYRADLTLTVERAADAPDRLTPGETYTLRASVKDGPEEIPDAEVTWGTVDSADQAFILPVRDSRNRNTGIFIGRKPPKGSTVPEKIVVKATYSGKVELFTIPYGDGTKTDDPEKPNVETAKVEDIIVKRTVAPVTTPTPEGGADAPSPFDQELDYNIESGQRLALTATPVKVDETDKRKLPEVVWSIPKDMEKYIAMLPQSDADKKDGKAVFFGLTPESGEPGPARESLYVLVKAKDIVKAVPISNGEQSVDVSWSILPRDIVAKIYGRNISDKYYAIEVVIGNNSGNDLQLSGMSFRLNSSMLRDGSGDNMPSWAPVVSYEAVRGINEEKRLAFNRSTIISGLDAAAQVLTGFTPFFHVATRARNFSQGINILSNPVTKGIERVWPDPQQDELNRLERQAMHGDKIVRNNAVERTMVFVAKETLINCVGGTSNEQQNGAKGKKAECLDADNLLKIRQRLGHLLLSGRKLNRDDFQLRVRPSGFRAPGSNRLN